MAIVQQFVLTNAAHTKTGWDMCNTKTHY